MFIRRDVLVFVVIYDFRTSSSCDITVMSDCLVPVQ